VDFMGRKRIPEKEKKIKVSISVKKYILEEIKGKESNLSEYIEKLIINDLYRT